MARPFQKIGHGLERFSFRRRRSVSSSSSSPLSLASDGTDASSMEAQAPAQPFTRRALSRSCGSKGSRLSVDLPPPLAGGPSDKGADGSSSSLAVPPKPVRHEGPPSGDGCSWTINQRSLRCCNLESCWRNDSLWSVADAEIVREKFSKLLLGEDMSGTGKGVTSALALSNAITNLAGNPPFLFFSTQESFLSFIFERSLFISFCGSTI